ncbi:ACP phosphodiesterase [Marinobacter bryozoorum]|uniref:acyl carrier protein phosphodiesterase n=1 Tax=Marinobacter bryozoorum TaxID=256324 RepID=UPI002006CCCE|nr:ACP phosphodiesterase [Marinobacter bryozoorum]
MNHFAHLYLARPTVESRVGNLLGDFAQGLDTDRLPKGVRAGLEHHRAVDAYTDAHPEVLACKALFSTERRRFAGIALDILFDHYLLRHWDRFGQGDRSRFIAELYRDLEQGEQLMPAEMARVTRSMVTHDWFHAYQDLEKVGAAMDRVAQRIRFRHQFAGIIEEIRPLDRELEARFLTFFPDLKAFSQSRSHSA